MRISANWVRAGLIAGLVCVAGGESRGAELPLLLEENFEKGADRWEPTDPKAWRIEENVGGKPGKAFAQFAQSKYKPPHRSPLNFALCKDVVVGDFVLEATVSSTTREYGHRDACVIFGHQDPAHFYYVHLGSKTDDHANQIFLVKDAPRIKISTKTSKGTHWTEGPHKIKVTRTAADGKIAIYFEDLENPCMEATDTNFAWGRFGIGSFDDTTVWDDVVVRGTKAEPPK